MTFLAVVAHANTQPLTGLQLLLIFALCVVILWVCSFLEETAEIDDARPPRILGSGPKPR